MVTIQIHNDYMFTDETAELIEDYLDVMWASEGVDYRWINPRSIELTLSDEPNIYHAILEDMTDILYEHYSNKNLIPKYLLDSFSICFLETLTNRS